MIKRKLKDPHGLAGWIIVAMVLAFAVIVSGFISASRNDRTREYSVCRERVEELVKENYGFIPEMECETVRDFGEYVLVAVRFRPSTQEAEYHEGSYLINISDHSQQVYNISDEYAYGYDYAAHSYRFADEWGIERRPA